MQQINDKKFCFIICANDDVYLNECISYIERLHLPEGYEIDLLEIRDAKSMASGYNEAMNATDAKYKIYLHQDTFIVYRYFLDSLLELFDADKDVGMIGMTGCEKMPGDGVMWHSQLVGNLYGEANRSGVENPYDTYKYSLSQGYWKVEAVDGFLMATSVDIPFNEQLFCGWDFYDASHSFDMRLAGKKILVPVQTIAWCIHDDGVLNLKNYNKYRQIFIREYLEKTEPKKQKNCIFMEWNSLGNEDIKENLKFLNVNIKTVDFGCDTIKKDEIKELILKTKPNPERDFVFSFNYYPEISKCCMELNLKYVSWVYDNPHINLFSYTISNPCNRCFVFDRELFNEFASEGIDTVFYLPLGVNNLRMERLDRELLTKKEPNSFEYDISFVGSLYTEEKNRLFQRIKNTNSYAEGYLEGLITSQLNIWGVDLFDNPFPKEVMDKLEEIYPTNPNPTTVYQPERLYKEYICQREVTARERLKVLSKAGEISKVSLFTTEKDFSLENVENFGPCDYYDQMPYIFRNSKINLNITLRSIKSGIPLRALDICGNGGFLLSNYQAELCEYLTPNEDFVYYEDYEDLKQKIAYYLAHDKERKQIAENGLKKVREIFDYRKKLEQILNSL